VYPVPSFVTEEMLANDMKKLELEKAIAPKDSSGTAPKLKSTAPSGQASGYGARLGSLHRVFLMRDAATDEPYKYGFAEFWTMEDAAAAMTKFKLSRSFTVAACSASVSYIHMGVFLPEDRQITPETERTCFHPLFNPQIRVRYRDSRAYPSQFVVTPEPPVAIKDIRAAPNEAAADKKSKKRKAESALSTTAMKKAVPMAGQMAMWQRKHNEIFTPGSRANETSVPEEHQDDPNKMPIGGSLGSTGGSKTSVKADANAPIKISLSGSRIGGSPSQAGSVGSAPSPSRDESRPRTSEEKDSTAMSFVDRDRLMCLICMRKYKSVDEVNIHEKSRNHRAATEDEERVKAALPRLAARDKRIQKQTEEANDPATTAQYRDRAQERREAFQQPKKPTPQHQSKSSDTVPSKTSRTDNKPAAPTVPKAPQISKGAGMLAKMGWTAGAGLGANADGRTEAIATNAYQEGVGLGADGGNLGDAAELAERKTTSTYADYVSSVQDRARERYNKLD
jgi:RNA-binding protein 5/10